MIFSLFFCACLTSLIHQKQNKKTRKPRNHGTMRFLPTHKPASEARLTGEDSSSFLCSEYDFLLYTSEQYQERESVLESESERSESGSEEEVGLISAANPTNPMDKKMEKIVLELVSLRDAKYLIGASMVIKKLEKRLAKLQSAEGKSVSRITSHTVEE